MNLTVRLLLAAGALLATILVTSLCIRGWQRHLRARGLPEWSEGKASAHLWGIVSAAGILFGVWAAFATEEDGPAAQTPAAGTADPQSPASADPVDALDEGLIGRLQDGSDVSVFTDVLGEPGYRRPLDGQELGTDSLADGSQEWGWARTGQYVVRAIVDVRRQVTAFSVTTLADTFRPDITHLAVLADRPLRLGETTFDGFSEAFDVPVSPVTVDGTSPGPGGTWYYTETFEFPRPLFRRFVLMHGSTGDGAPNAVVADLLFSVAERLREACPTGACPDEVMATDPLRAARDSWPITSFTVYGEDFPDDVAGLVLAAEPQPDDIEEADPN